MISKRLLWLIAVPLAGLLAFAWWGGRYPARVTIINASGDTLHDVEIRCGEQRVVVQTIPNGGTQSVALTAGNLLGAQRVAGLGVREGVRQKVEHSAPNRLESTRADLQVRPPARREDPPF